MCHGPRPALRTILIVFALMTVLSSTACGGPEAKTVVIVQDAGRGPRLEFEGLRLLMPAVDVVNWATQRNFTHNVDTDGDAKQNASIQPHSHPVRRYELKFENGRLISLTVHYVMNDPKRADIRKHYSLKRKRLDGTWVMTDTDRQTVVMVNRDGNQLVAVHAGQAANRKEIEAMFELFFKEKADERPTKPAVDPKAGEAHL